MGQAQPAYKQYCTFEEYLNLEKELLEKYEYRNGALVAMAGGSLNHGIIGGNVVTTINNGLRSKRKSCIVTNSEVKIFIESYNHGVYPDALVLCEPPAYYRDSKSTIINPTLVVEVLSASTKDYDLGNKFLKYISLPDLQEYMVVWQTIPKVYTWYKIEDNVWRISNAMGLDASIQLYSIDCVIPLSDIYAQISDLNTNFAEAEY